MLTVIVLLHALTQKAYFMSSSNCFFMISYETPKFSLNSLASLIYWQYYCFVWTVIVIPAYGCCC